MNVKKILEDQMARLEECAKRRGYNVDLLCELTEKMVMLAKELRWLSDYETRPETSGGKGGKQ